MLTYTAANRIVNAIAKSTSASFSTLYVGLSTTAPNRDGTGVTEPPSSAGYARKLLNQGNFNSPTVGTASNTETIYFAEATGDWGECKYFCLFEGNGANSNLIAYQALTSSISPTNGKVPLIRSGQLTFTM